MAQDDYIDPAQKEILLIDVIKKQLIRGILIYFFISNVFIFLRIVLRLFGADPANLFAGFIYAVSGFFLLPFVGFIPRFAKPIQANEPVVDVTAFIAAFCIDVLVILAIIVIYLGTRMIRTRRQAREAVEKSKPVDATEAEDAVD